MIMDRAFENEFFNIHFSDLIQSKIRYSIIIIAFYTIKFSMSSPNKNKFVASYSYY